MNKRATDTSSKKIRVKKIKNNVPHLNVDKNGFSETWKEYCTSKGI
jgi:hypothetical protein